MAEIAAEADDPLGLFAVWAAADHDPAVYDNPHEVILDRHPNPHLAYGAGIHRR